MNVRDLRAANWVKNVLCLERTSQTKGLETSSCPCRARMGLTSGAQTAPERKLNIKNGDVLALVVALAFKVIAAVAASARVRPRSAQR